MSRIGKAPVAIPSGVTVTVNGILDQGEGSQRGAQYQHLTLSLRSRSKSTKCCFSRSSDLPDHRAKHGLYRSLCAGMVEGVTNGYKKELELVGVGFRAQASGQQLTLALGIQPPHHHRGAQRNQVDRGVTEGFQPQGDPRVPRQAAARNSSCQNPFIAQA